MVNQPLVSIVIPVFNGEDFLDEAIKSAINQTYRNIEILVINDGSTDGTEKIANKYEKQIRYFYKENGGVASALNLAIKEMKGEYFSWLSHDDYYDPSKIEYEVKAVQQQEDKNSIVYCDYSLLDQKTGVFSTYKIEDYYSPKDRSNGVLMLIQRMIGGCTLLIHVSHFKKAGMFNEQLKTTQDYDMWFRMFREIKLIHVPQSLVVTRIHKRQGSCTIKEFDSEREQLFLSFLKDLTLAEKIDIWGSEYTCLRNFLLFFESYLMKNGTEYVKRKLKTCEKPKQILEKQERAKTQIIQGIDSTDVKIAIMGAGDYGRRVLKLLRSRGIEADIFLDNHSQKWGCEIEGIICNSVESELCDKESILVILAAELFGQMQQQLFNLRFKKVITKMHLEGMLYNVPPIGG